MAKATPYVSPILYGQYGFQDFGFDIGEFFTNVVPRVHDFLISSSDPYHNYTMKTLFTISTINPALTVTTWYDSIDDKTN
jgi:hypothetical protein